jgi:hypothetical protein
MDPLDSTGGASLSLDSLWQILGVDACNASLPDPLLGRDLGGVTLQRVIGEGGMGRVYEGLQTAPSRTVAVKLLRPGIASREIHRRFATEAEILGRLRHAAIAQVYATGTFTLLETQVPYFVMEYVSDSLSITEYAKQRQLPLADRLSLFQDVVEAIAYGHANGVIHRDIKPGNILVDGDGKPKVIDFGVARWSGREGDTRLTEFGQVMGTLQYMSPEQINGPSNTVDPRTDVYSLGLVLYELLADTRPFDLRDASVVEAARDIPRRVSAVVDRCLAKQPVARFASAAELRDALKKAVIAAAPSRSRSPATLVLAGVALLATGGLVLRPIASVSARFVERLTAHDTAAFRFTTVDAADPHLVEHSGVRKYREWQTPPLVYWGPEENDREGRLCYRFDYPNRTQQVRLIAKLSCWDFSKEPGGVGRGAAAIEVSRDGQTWLAVRDGVERRLWGSGWTIDELIPSEACGTTSLWVRVRLLAEAAPNTSYTTAQFGRAESTSTTPVFALDATLAAPKTEH